MTEEPPWLEITTDDYAPRIFPDNMGGAAWIASSECLRTLLQRQHDGEVRLRLILRESVDFRAAPSRDPGWKGDYYHGPDLALGALEVWIERKDGRRKRVDNVPTRPKPW